MSTALKLAKHLKEVYFGGNWTGANYKSVLDDIDWKEATHQIFDMNTIVTLVQHTGYYIDVQLKAFQGHPLDGKDEYSFAHPPIQSQEDWNTFLQNTFHKAEQWIAFVEKLPDTQLNEPFTDAKFGNYFRNLQGAVEHLHYHLGQIVIIKKLIKKTYHTI